jgi:peroxiredoxin family protein
MSKPLVIYLHSDSYDRIYQALNILATAKSAGRQCYLFLFYHALGAFAAGAWDDMEVAPSSGRVNDPPDRQPPWQQKLQRSFELANLPSLHEMLDGLRGVGRNTDFDTRTENAVGSLDVYACSNSTQYLGLDPADVGKQVDEIVGLATMLEITNSAGQVLYI